MESRARQKSSKEIVAAYCKDTSTTAVDEANYASI